MEGQTDRAADGDGRRVLVVGPAWVGDMVMAQTLFITLAAQGTEVDVLAPAWSLPLLGRMAQVHTAHALPLGHGQLDLATRWRTGRGLRARHYHQAIVLPRSFKAALVPLFAGIPRRTGYRAEFRYGLLNDIRPLDRVLLPRVVDRYVALGLPAAAPLPPADIPQPRLQVDLAGRPALCARLGIGAKQPAVALMPGAEYGPAKRWPLEHYAAAARQLLAGGHQVWVLGAAREQGDGEAIAAMAPGVRNLCGQTRLEEVVDLLSLCSGAISNDSGLMHIAAACDIPLVALYGSSTPAYTPPLSARARVIYRGLECSPCFQRTCPLGHLRCLTEISPEEVLEALQQ